MSPALHDRMARHELAAVEETAKTELGLAHNETRSWHGWHRHVSLVMLAFALLAVIRHHANAPPPKKRARPRPPAR